MKTRNIIGLILIAVFTAVLIISYSNEASIYTDFATAKSSGDYVHIVGKWVNRDQSGYDPQTGVFSFFVQDTMNTTQLVEYNDPKPQNLENADKVVIEGKMKGQVFVAEKILIKCPSKYQNNTLRADTTYKSGT